MTYHYGAYKLCSSGVPQMAREKTVRVQTCSQPLMSILKYVTSHAKQPSRKLKDHNLECTILPVPALLPQLGTISPDGQVPDMQLFTIKQQPSIVSTSSTKSLLLDTSVWNICLVYICTSMHACSQCTFKCSGYLCMIVFFFFFHEY